VFDEIRVLDEWNHSVSDDYSMTRALQAPRAVQSFFVPECLTPAYVDVDFHGPRGIHQPANLDHQGFTRKGNWALGAATHFLYCLTLPLGLAVTLTNFFATLPAFSSGHTDICA